MKQAGKTSEKNVLVVRDMPHFAPYLQFLTNIIQIHFEKVKLGGNDYRISAAITPEQLGVLHNYLMLLLPGAPIEIKAREVTVLYAVLVVVSRLLLSDYGEEICLRLTRNLSPQHPWSHYDTFRNTLLRHNSQMLLDMDQRLLADINGLDELKQKLKAISL
ncbi:MAG TPA: hypothetical protein VL093_02290 [Flavipsychrobacter sp.]|nr:hypothetical protein [Flavipsychrobacter sp.]